MPNKRIAYQMSPETKDDTRVQWAHGTRCILRMPSGQQADAVSRVGYMVRRKYQQNEQLFWLIFLSGNEEVITFVSSEPGFIPLIERVHFQLRTRIKKKLFSYFTRAHNRTGSGPDWKKACKPRKWPGRCVPRFALVQWLKCFAGNPTNLFRFITKSNAKYSLFTESPAVSFILAGECTCKIKTIYSSVCHRSMTARVRIK